MAQRKRYTDEFKVEAVKLTETSTATIATIAKELGVSLPTLNEWRARAKRGKLRGPGGKVVSFNDTSEMQRLKRENSHLQKENQILKLAPVGSPHCYFAKENLARRPRSVRFNHADQGGLPGGTSLRCHARLPCWIRQVAQRQSR